MDYGSPTAKSMSFDPDSMGNGGGNVRETGHNQGDASDPRSKKSKKAGRGKKSGYKKKSGKMRSSGY
ncbi:MAG: hypothetical protein ACR2RE_03595 [Geminicoccaceae bacterium]